MSGIYRTNDPNQFARIDSIVIDEKAPPPSIGGVPTNVVIMLGQFERGSEELSLAISSTGSLFEQYGDNDLYSGNLALKNKKFSSLRLIRVVASDAVTASDNLVTSEIDVEALYKGAYGNSIKVKIEPGSDAVGKKYTISDTSDGAVLPDEVFDQVVLVGKTQQQLDEIFGASKLVKFVALAAITSEPADQVATALTSGSDGTLADTDYETALVKAEQERAGNLVFLDQYNATRNGYLEVHVASTQDKMCIICGGENDDVATVSADAANFRDADGRIIYGWPWVQTSINGANVWQNPASWIASAFSQTAAHVSLAYISTVQYYAGVSDLKYKVGRNDFITLNDAGVAGLQFDPDVGIKIRNAVTTHLINDQKRPILRRRMADFLTNSIAYFLKAYDNDVNSAGKRDEVKSGILDFDARLVRDGVLPGVNDVQSGDPLLVDVESANTDDVVAQGKFIILYKRRIFSSMRFIVLRAEIGTGVVVTEQ